MDLDTRYVCWLDDLDSNDVGRVGGKNASLGEMIQRLSEQGVRVPIGFATTADAYWTFIDANELRGPIRSAIEAWSRGDRTLHDAATEIRERITAATLPDDVADAISHAYRALAERLDTDAPDVAARSSATAEDLPEASFAGQQETYLNVVGEDALREACRRCFASLFTDRAVSYRAEQGFGQLDVALSVGVQQMVRSDEAAAGVMFTIDTETGFPDVVLISAALGLGESVVQGTVRPDEYRVFKPRLSDTTLRPILEKRRGAKEEKVVYRDDESGTTTVPTTAEEQAALVLEDDEILQLARWGATIERHYGRPQDIEWAKDGRDGQLYIVQARPETVQAQRETAALRTYTLEEEGKRLLTGLAIGDAIASGAACVIEDAAEIDRFAPGAVLVTGMTDPDWVPIMRQAAGIITDSGGRTSHAAIVSRELGVPAVVGTGEATATLRDGQPVTLSCAEGEHGYVYDGALAYHSEEIDLAEVPETRTRLMLNIASPAGSLRWWRLPVHGIGLARMEFIIGSIIKVHPMALVRFEALEDEAAREEIEQLTAGYDEKTEYFVDQLARGIAQIAAPQYPDPVIVRTSDFKTNEYADLIGGRAFEPQEANPMLGFRGAARYTHERYRAGFALECRALRRAREVIGLDNIVVMIPFCRTVEEADRTLEVMADHGLVRGESGLKVYVMAEIPSNIVRASAFAERFDGFSIGSNDLTQLTLGVDRDSTVLADLFDERDPAVVALIRQLIERAHAAGRPVGICGQAPSDHPEFAATLVEAGIDSISLSPDSVLAVKQRVAEAEAAKTAHS